MPLQPKYKIVQLNPYTVVPIINNAYPINVNVDDDDDTSSTNKNDGNGESSIALFHLGPSG